MVFLSSHLAARQILAADRVPRSFFALLRPKRRMRRLRRMCAIRCERGTRGAMGRLATHVRAIHSAMRWQFEDRLTGPRASQTTTARKWSHESLPAGGASSIMTACHAARARNSGSSLSVLDFARSSSTTPTWTSWMRQEAVFPDTVRFRHNANTRGRWKVSADGAATAAFPRH